MADVNTTIATSGGDYASLALAEADDFGCTSGQSALCEYAESMTDTTAVDINTSVPSSIEISVQDAYWHKGDPTAGAVLVPSTGTRAIMVRYNTTINRLRIDCTNVTDAGIRFYNLSSINYFDQLFIHNIPNNVNGIYVDTNASNNVIGSRTVCSTNGGGSARGFYCASSATLALYFCTAYSTGYSAFLNNATCHCYGCVGFGMYPFNGAFSGDYNVDNTSNSSFQAPGANSVSNLTASNELTDVSNDDFSILSGGTGTLIDLVTTTSYDSFFPDIAGNSKSGTYADCGAFEFVSGGGTTLYFAPINSNSVLNNNFLSAIRSLTSNNINCFTEISDSIISGLVNIIQGNDLSATSQITQASVQAIRKLIGQEISSLSQITEVALQSARFVGLNDIDSLTEVTSVVFSVIKRLNNTDITISSQVVNEIISVIKKISSDNINTFSQITDVDLSKIMNIHSNNLSVSSEILDISLNIVKYITLNNIESPSQITEAIVYLTGGIRGVDIEVQSQITSVVLSILRSLQQNNIEVNSIVGGITLQAIKYLPFIDISSSSELTTVVLNSANSLGVIDNNIISQITDSLLYVIRSFSPISINIQSNISNPVISALRNIYSSIVNTPSNVSDMKLSIVGVTVIGKVTVAFSMNAPGIGWEVE